MSEYELEIREQAGREPTLYGVLIQEGRAATGGRAELFAPGSIEWPSEGVEVRTAHLQPTQLRGQVVRQRDGRLTLTARATDAIRAAYAAGRRFLSVEFASLNERTTRAGVREIQRAMVTAAAMVERPEYDIAIAEVRAVASGVTADRKREEALRWL